MSTNFNTDLLENTFLYRSLTWKPEVVRTNIINLVFYNLSYILLNWYFRMGTLFKVVYVFSWIGFKIFVNLVQAKLNGTTFWKSLLKEAFESEYYLELRAVIQWGIEIGIDFIIAVLQMVLNTEMENDMKSDEDESEDLLANILMEGEEDEGNEIAGAQNTDSTQMT